MQKLYVALIVLLTAFSAQAAVNNTIITNTQCVAVDATNLGTAGIHVTGTWTGSLQPQNAIGGQPPVNLGSAITANGFYSVTIAGSTLFQVCGNTVTSGSATVYLSTAPTASANGRAITPSTLNNVPQIDGLTATMQSVYTRPGFNGGLVDLNLPAGITVTDPIDLYLNTASLGGPTLTTTTSCSGITNFLTNGQNLSAFYFERDIFGNPVFSAPTQIAIPGSGSNCFTAQQNNPWIWVGAGANNSPQGWQELYAVSCAGPCTINNNGGQSTPPVSGATLQFSNQLSGSWAWPIDNVQRFFGYTTSASSLTIAGGCIYPSNTTCPTGIQPPAADLGLTVNNVLIRANTNGGIFVHCAETVPASSQFFGYGRQATYLQLGQTCPNGIPSVAVAGMNMITSGSQTATAGNILTIVEAFSESGATGSEAIFEYPYPAIIGPFFTGAKNAQVVAPSIPLTQQSAVPGTQLLVGDRITDNNAVPAIWVTTIQGVTAGLFTAACTTPLSTTASFGTAQLECLAAPAVWQGGSHVYAAQTEIYDPVTGTYQYLVNNAAGVPAGCTGGTSTTPTFSATFGTITTESTGTPCQWMSDALNTTYQPTYQVYTASCSNITVNICPWSALALNGSAGLVNFSGCTQMKDRNTQAQALQTCGSGASAVLLTFQGTGGGTSIATPTLTSGTCPPGFASCPNMPANQVWGGYVFGTRNGISQWQGEGAVTLTANHALIINKPPAVPPNAEGWNPFACFTSTCNFLETQQVPDGIHTICGTGAPNQYVPFMPHGYLCSFLAANATIVDPQTAVPYAPQFNETDVLWNGGGLQTNQNTYSVPLPINGAAGSANGTISASGYASKIGYFSEECGRVLNTKEPAGLFYASINIQEEGGIAGDILGKDCAGGGAYVNGFSGQNSYLNGMQFQGLSSESTFGVAIQDDGGFRSLSDCSCSAYAQNANFYSLFGVGIIGTQSNMAANSVQSFAIISGIECEVTQHCIDFRGGSGILFGVSPTNRAGGKVQTVVHADGNAYDISGMGVKSNGFTCGIAEDPKGYLCRSAPGNPTIGPFSLGDINGSYSSTGRMPDSGIAGASATVGVSLQLTGLGGNGAYQTVYNTGSYIGKGGAGAYRVCVDALTTTAGATSVAPSIDVSWNDGTGAVAASITNAFAVAWVLTSTSVGSQFSGCVQIHSAQTQNIQVGTGQITSGTYNNSPQYTVEVNVEALQ